MPALFVLMIVLIIRGVTLPGGWEGVKFLFMPRWEDFSGAALFNAMGFCFFSLSLGAGTMITYRTYLSDKANLPGSVGWVAVLAILSSLLGGLLVSTVLCQQIHAGGDLKITDAAHGVRGGNGAAHKAEHQCKCADQREKFHLHGNAPMMFIFARRRQGSLPSP